MFLRIFSFSKILFFSSLSTKRLFKMSTVMGSGGYFQFLVLNLTATTQEFTLRQLFSDAAPCPSTQPFEVAAIFAPCAKLASGFAFATLAVQGLEEVTPVHVHGTPWQHGGIFSQIMILAAAQAAAVLQPLVMTIQFHEFRKF